MIMPPVAPALHTKATDEILVHQRNERNPSDGNKNRHKNRSSHKIGRSRRVSCSVVVILMLLDSEVKVKIGLQDCVEGGSECDI